MFVCENCLDKNQWESTMFRSFGSCEVCNKQAACADIPSKHVILKTDDYVLDATTGEKIRISKATGKPY